MSLRNTTDYRSIESAVRPYIREKIDLELVKPQPALPRPCAAAQRHRYVHQDQLALAF